MNESMASGWCFTDADRARAEALQEHLPARLFDSHAHLYRTADLQPCSPFVASGPEVADLALWRRYVGNLVGADRLHGALCTPFPTKEGDLEAINTFIAEQTESDPACRATIVVNPKSVRKHVEELLAAHPRLVGFKPYHFYAAREDTFQADVTEFLPEWVWEIADERGMVILLHMVKHGALSDPANQRDLRDLCRRYPNARLILAHVARGFHAPNTVEAVSSLSGLQNAWFDLAAVCESEAMAAVLQEFGPRKLLWGTDFPISQQRGRCVTLGTGFTWVTTDQVQWNEKAFFGEPLVVGLESLRAALDMCRREGLNADDRQDIFCDNALRLLGLAKEAGTATQDLYRKAKTIIPGGTQLLSKRPELAAPDQWPAYFREARGCEVWDIDGRHYYDCHFSAVSATILGFRDPDVTAAVRRRLSLGSVCSLNPPEEVELAERLCAIHPWAEQARFTRAGGEAMAVAVRIARATTDRSAVAVCGYHGWHDWYLAANLGETDALRGHLLPGLDPLGVPRELRDTNFPFTYNSREEFQRILDGQGHRLAAVVMEPCRYHDPAPGFLEYVRDAAHAAGALVIFDEVTIGWRLVYGGAHLRLGVAPDIAVFGKTLSNGHLMAAVIGARDAMAGAHGSFISSSYWTEGVGPAAALATLSKMERIDVPAHCRRMGSRVQEAWRASAQRHNLPVEVEDGYPALAHFAFDHELAAELKTLYAQCMLERGFLAGLTISITLAHTDEVIDMYAAAIDEVFAEISDALRKGDVKDRLKGPVAHSGFRRLL